MKKVLTYGTFDLLHEGHINILKSAKKFGDYLVVGLSTDEFNELKNKKAFDSFAKRKEELLKTGLVDLVIPEDNWEQKIDDIKTNGIDVFVMGSDWNGKFDFLSEYCEVHYPKRTDGISSTMLREKILRTNLLGNEITLLDLINFFENIDVNEIDELTLQFEKEFNFKIEKMTGSLSNWIFKVSNYIIKFNSKSKIEWKKMNVEFEYLNYIGKECYRFDKGIIIEYTEGELLRHTDLNNSLNIDLIFDSAKKINNYNSEINAPLYDICKKYSENKNRLIDGLESNGLEPKLIDDAIKFYSNFDMALIHSDLNEGNIIIDNEGKLKLIDFGNLSFSQWIYEYVVFIVNWNLDEENIEYILNTFLNKIKFNEIWPLLAVYAIDIMIWNQERGSNVKNKNKVEQIKERINFLRTLSI